MVLSEFLVGCNVLVIVLVVAVIAFMLLFLKSLSKLTGKKTVVTRLNI
jgi:hypothetical protein